MIALLKSLWSWFSGSTIGKYLIEGLALIGAIGGLYAKIRLDGEAEERAKETDATLKSVETARKVEQTVIAKPDAQVDSELANEFNR